MAYNFKNLADVELLDTMPESANVLVEVDGATKRAPKEDGIGKLTSAEVLEGVPEGATVLAEVNGEIKRVPSNQVGGIDAIIFSVIEAAGALDETPTYQTVCNHTPEEVGELMLAGANCFLLVPYVAMQNVSTYATSRPMPTVCWIPMQMGYALDDGSYMVSCLIPNEIIINYHADGTIENSLFTQQES